MKPPTLVHRARQADDIEDNLADAFSPACHRVGHLHGCQS